MEGLVLVPWVFGTGYCESCWWFGCWWFATSYYTYRYVERRLLFCYVHFLSWTFTCTMRLCKLAMLTGWASVDMQSLGLIYTGLIFVGGSMLWIQWKLIFQLFLSHINTKNRTILLFLLYKPFHKGTNFCKTKVVNI